MVKFLQLPYTYDLSETKRIVISGDYECYAMVWIVSVLNILLEYGNEFCHIQSWCKWSVHFAFAQLLHDNCSASWYSIFNFALPFIQNVVKTIFTFSMQ